MLDFNEQPAQRVDLDALKKALADSAMDWAPRLFPNARDGNGELRLANIQGQAPGKSGSCVVTLTGPSAGCWYDHSGSTGGGPLDTLAQATGLHGAELIDKALELTNGHAHGLLRSAPLQSAPPKPSYRRDHTSEISFIRAKCVPLAATLAEIYLKSRGPEDPQSPDLLFHDNLTDWNERRGRPAMVAVIRDPAGEPTGGLHRTYLKDDGTGKADVAKPKMMIGPSGGAVRLFPIGDDGVLGIAEGIESALAASIIHGVPVWATLSTSGMQGFEPPQECVRLIIYRDAGDAGQQAADKAAETARLRGIAAEIVSPKHGDDFADDLAKRDQPETAQSQTTQSQTAQTQQTVLEPGTLEYVSSMIAALEKHGDAMLEIQVAKAIADLRPDKTTENLLIDKLCKQSGMRKPTAVKLVKSQYKTVSSAPYLFDDDGRVVRCVHNAVTAIKSSPDWHGLIGWNLFELCVTVRGKLPWEDEAPEEERKWQDVNDIDTASWLQQQGVFVPTSVANDAVVSIAHKAAFHPVAEYLDSLTWDGIPRIEDWLTRVFGCERDDYHKAVGSKTLIAAVRRIRQPGCKFDCMMILEGPQGLMKSTALSVLFGQDYYTDQMPRDLGGAEASKALAGKWCIEFAEIDQIIRSEVETVKAFLSRKVDHYRPSFGRAVIDQKRQCVMIGTTNSTQYLKDDSGNRRFWPVACLSDPVADIDWLRSNRDHLWAEAVQAEASGAAIWLDQESVLEFAKGEQEVRMIEDSWLDGVEKYVRLLTSSTTSEIMAVGLSIPVADHSRASQMRVASIMKRLGWASKVEKEADRSVRRWKRY